LLQDDEGAIALVRRGLHRMARNGADFTLTFRRLSDAAVSSEADRIVRSLFTDPTAYDDWTSRWRRRLADDGEGTGQRRAAVMRAGNPPVHPPHHSRSAGACADGHTG